jgi:hypothetical protein
MPIILRVKGHQFFFYAQDANEPVHIHVAKAGCDAKYWLTPIRLAVNHGFRPHDLREIADIVEENEILIIERWNEFFRP